MSKPREIENQCCAGCHYYSGYEVYHIKDCIHYPHSFSKMYDDLQAKLDVAVEELKDFLDMIDEGLLVRDISKDHSPSFTMDSMKFVMRLKRKQEALDKIKGAGDE